MSDPTEQVAVVARAIADANTGGAWSWDTGVEVAHQHYYKLAAAAIDALGLTEERRSFRIRGEHPLRSRVQRVRLVGPWVEGER